MSQDNHEASQLARASEDSTAPDGADGTVPPPRRENIWVNLALNCIIPSVLMTKGAKWFSIEPAPLLILALSFPVCYGIYDLITRRKFNFFSILGFVSVLITGGVGLLGLPKDWIAIKEAAIPAMFAVAVLISLVTPFPLVRALLYNPEIFNVPKIDAALEENDKHDDFEKLMRVCTLLLAGSFIASAILNFGLARLLIQHDPKTDLEQYNVDVGKMTAWSYPVIMVPSMAIMMVALFKLANGIERFTGYSIEDVMHIGQKSSDSVAPDQSPEAEADGALATSASDQTERPEDAADGGSDQPGG